MNAVIRKEIGLEKFSQYEHHPHKDEPNACNWLFVLDTLNFCFWTPGNATKWKVNGATGYFALCEAIHRAILEGIDITNPVFYSNITADVLGNILRSDDGITQCPLIDERVKCLQDVGKILIKKYNGTFRTCLSVAENSAQKLLQLIVDEFGCYRDEAIFNGQRVSILKRAQILVGDIWACFLGKSPAAFEDIETITMFADYRVPQVLVHFGCMKYNESLMDFLRQGM